MLSPQNTPSAAEATTCLCVFLNKTSLEYVRMIQRSDAEESGYRHPRMHSCTACLGRPADGGDRLRTCAQRDLSRQSAGYVSKAYYARCPEKRR